MINKHSFIWLFPESKFEITPHELDTDPSRLAQEVYIKGLEFWLSAEQMLSLVDNSNKKNMY